VGIDGSRFAGVVGQFHVQGTALRVTAIAGGNGALQVHPLQALEAADFSILRYRFDGLPRTLELTFVFRRENEDDVQVVTVPGTGDGWASFDLSLVPGWHGRISEIGIAEHPGAQSVPPAVAFRPFSLERVELQSRSWSGVLAARWHDWFGRQNWELMSLSALGPDSSQPRSRPLAPMLAIGVLGTVLLGWAIARWRGPVLIRGAAVVVLLAWLLLDLRWLHNLHHRHAATRDIYAGRPVSERARLLPDQATAHAAGRVRELLGDLDADTRVFVDSGSDFTRARLFYHLLPLNLAPVNLVGYGTPVQRANAIVVLFGQTQPSFDRSQGVLLFDTGPMPAEQLLDEGALQVYRLGAAP
jgi:hypothetical protein